MTEKIIAVVKAYSVGAPDSLVVVIPKEVHAQLAKNPKGQKFVVKLDGKGRLIYEPIEEMQEKPEKQEETKYDETTTEQHS